MQESEESGDNEESPDIGKLSVPIVVSQDGI
ncbi:hypothetical protein C8R11_10326 [Nitrosomonas aestuarii]|nr:hypothetical protein C8R11_10326 [Nitrosomonas aestuarii]